ncbi:MAG: NAD-dependent epimerase/dehydratase family protein [Thermoanaerobaculia bacterium]
MTHVVVTGGACFIGSHLVDAYLARGWRVSVIDDLSTGDRRNLNPKAEFHEADLLAAGALIERLRPDVISHHAAQVDVRKSVEDPARDAELNIVASLRLLQKAAETGVKRVIFASSGGAIYGEPAFAPQTEAHPLRPMSPYGCAKLSVEQYMSYYREVLGLSTVALRYANVYGPRQGAKGEAGVVAIFARLLLAGRELTINGTGEQTRDFVYVGDVVRANLAVTDDASLSGALNVGTGVETSVNDLYREMAALIPRGSSMRRAPAKVGEQMRSVLDGARFGPYRSLPDGLRETVDWFMKELVARSS